MRRLMWNNREKAVVASLGSYLVLQHRSGSFLLCTFANTPGPIRDFEIHHTCFKFFSTRDDAGVVVGHRLKMHYWAMLFIAIRWEWLSRVMLFIAIRLKWLVLLCYLLLLSSFSAAQGPELSPYGAALGFNVIETTCWSTFPTRWTLDNL